MLFTYTISNITAVNQTVMRIVFLIMASVNSTSNAAVVLKSPAPNSSVIITNDLVQKWWDGYEKGDGYRAAKKKNLSKPEPVILRWDMTGTDASASDCDYTVWVSQDSQFKNSLIFDTRKKYCKVYNLYRGRKYYWRVRAIGDKLLRVSETGTFYTNNTARIIRVKGVSNARDIGGYKTFSGRIVKQGLVYRSGNFDSIRKSGKETIRQLGIRTQLDLRRKKEGKAGKKTLPVENYYHLRGHSYLRLTRSKKRIQRIIKIMKVFAQPGNYPVVFHCTYGRDRTGTIAFLLNGLLGVSKKNLYRDYELTYLSKYSGSSGKERLRNLDKLYHWLKHYKDPSQSLQYNIKAFLTENGMTETEIRNIEETMLE